MLRFLQSFRIRSEACHVRTAISRLPRHAIAS